MPDRATDRAPTAALSQERVLLMALRMRFVTTTGWLIIATCELLISTVCALALAAIARSASGGMAHRTIAAVAALPS
ncbi:hypothetical protein GCM10027080_37170 [Pedococcus soli]|nr:hypothetical protein ASC58_00010 [Phycicoccus sp. Root101]